MSVGGRRPSDARDVIVTALDGQTLTVGSWELTLGYSSEWLTPMLGADGCADGGFVVTLADSSTLARPTYPQSSGGRVQRVRAYTLSVQVSANVEGEPANFRDGRLEMQEQIEALIAAALEPQSGAIYIVSRFQSREPARPAPGGWLLFTINVSFEEPQS